MSTAHKQDFTRKTRNLYSHVFIERGVLCKYKYSFLLLRNNVVHMKIWFISITLGLRQVLQDFVVPEEVTADVDEEVGDPGDLLEVQNETVNCMLANLSAEDVDSVLEQFDLTLFSFPDSPTSIPSIQTNSTSFTTVTTPDTLADNTITSVPSVETTSTSFEKFVTISKSLEGTQSSNTNPDTYVDIVQQALYHPSVFGQDGSDFYF